MQISHYEKKKLAENIRVLRARENLTQKDLADLVETTSTTISNYENNQMSTKVDGWLVKKLANMFGVPVTHMTERSLLGLKQKNYSMPAAVRSINQIYEYMVELDGRRYRVINHRDITDNSENRFEREYYDMDHNMIADTRIIDALDNVIRKAIGNQRSRVVKRNEKRIGMVRGHDV